MTEAVKVRNGSYGKWSGPWIKGTRPYAVEDWQEGSWEDVVMRATVGPEGGCWDTLVAYDGTAVTGGFVQWTLTSMRLQKLLAECRIVEPLRFAQLITPVFTARGLRLSNDGILVHLDADMPATVDELRRLFTPPDGRCPRSGPHFERAAEGLRAFFEFFQCPTLDAVQRNFFLAEIEAESYFKRPRLHGATVASILYPTGWPKDWMQAEWPIDAARALFWAMSQNKPRTAEAYLYAINVAAPMTKDAVRFANRLALKFARSIFGYWGMPKCAICPKCGYQNRAGARRCAATVIVGGTRKPCNAALRESRYEKVAKVINRTMGCELPLKV